MDHSTSTTSDVRQTLRHLAATTWDEHLVDVVESHRWLEGFFDNLRAAGQARTKGGHRPVMSELMKTPGRKRLANTTNSSNVLNSTSRLTAARKDPVATLLFPRSGHSSPRKGKENASDENGAALMSPVVKNMVANNNRGATAMLSPMRSPMKITSPRVGSSVRSPAIAPGVIRSPLVQPKAAAIKRAEPVESAPGTPAREPATLDVLPEDLQVVREIEQEEVVARSPSAADADTEESNRFSTASTVAKGETADLSIIGEEEEEPEEQASAHHGAGDSSPSAPATIAPVANVLESSTSILLPAAQMETSQDTQETTAADKPVSSSATSLAPASPQRRIVSVASSHEDEADADTAVPLNDEPSTLRNAANPLSSSLPGSTGPAPSTTRTPGGTVSRYGTGSFSAAKLGVLMGSSPPAPSSTTGHMRVSTGGARQLNFVGLPKKSLGLGLGIGRNWTSNSATDSQGSQGSQSNSQPPAGAHPSVAPETSTGTGAVKRKSLSQDAEPNKVARVEPQDIEEAASKARRDALASRMKNMQARQSALPGSRTSGIMGASTNKPLVSTSSSAAPGVAEVSVFTASTTTVTSTSIFASTIAAKPISAAPDTAVAPVAVVSTGSTLVRRPSVMDRVRSFEKSSATDGRGPSPSKIPSATSYAASQQVSGISRPQSPLLGPSVARSPSALPRRPMSPVGSPLSKIASPHRMQLRSSPAVQAKSPARAMPMNDMTHNAHINPVSTTPKGSPTPAGSRSILQQLSKQSTERPLAARDLTIESAREAELSIRQVAPVSAARAQELEDEEPLSDHEARPSLPPPLATSEHGDQDDGDNTDDEDDESTVIEKGRGALVSAMEVEQDATAMSVTISAVESNMKNSESKTVMPGTFDGDDLDEDGDGDLSLEITESVHKSSAFKPTLQKKGSQASLASSQSSQSGGGMLSSLFGNKGKQKDGKLKSIQLAAAAAKKEQQDKERKAAQKEEREQKRLDLLQKRQQEERVKVEEDRRARAEVIEKKRKEREELAAKTNKILKSKMKVDEEPAKKRKIEPEVKRPEAKKPQQQFRPVNASSSSYQSSSLNTSQNRNPLATSQGRPGNMGPPSTSTTPASGLKSSQNSMVGVKFMAAPGAGPAGSNAPRAAVNGSSKPFTPSAPDSQHRPAPPPPQPEPEPYQELPDIDSEYSDSGDEGHDEKVRALPQWAQSPALADALYRQQRVNPDQIFGPIPPLSMQEIFRTNSTRITKRTSSACWEGTDALTADDLERYNRAMGFTTSTIRTSRMSSTSFGGNAR